MKAEYLKDLIDILYPTGLRCIVCGREIHKDRYSLCESCAFSLNENYCIRCGRHKIGLGDYCDECSKSSLAFDEARSSVVYESNAQKVIWRLKYGDAKYLAHAISEYMLDTLLFTDWDADCITFVPSDKKRYKKRGYNQAELIAKALAERTTLPCLALLDKTKSTPNQARLDKETRVVNLKGAFSVVSKPPDHVVLVDDVMTTGATVNECAKTLKAAGASVVYVLTFASVPEKAQLDKPLQNIREFRR